MAKYLLGIDNGGTMAKAALFTPDGREVAVASHKSEMLDVKPGWAEFDMNQVWANTTGSIKEVLETSGIDPAEVVAVACSGHGNGLYLVDENFQPVYNAIYSSDGRAREYIDQWSADGTAERMRPKTMQAIWPAQPNALLRWFMDNDPETLSKARWVLMCKDFVRAQLTGEVYMELSDMSATSLMNVETADYDDEVLEAWGLESLKHMMPPLKFAGDICGKITAAAAEATGLAEGTPVAGGLFDIDACGLASGLVDDDAISMVGGTWGNNQYASKTPIVHDVFITSRYVIPGYYYMLEGSPTSASNLEWMVTEFFQAEKKLAEAEGRSVYDVCNELVASTDPKDSGLIFLPFLYGCNVSLDGKACFIGLDGWQKRGHILRAIYEGVVFAHRWHMDKLLKHRDMPDSIRLTGGAARSVEWVQIFADVFQVPVRIPAGTELGALGAAMCAGVAAEVFDSYESAADAMVSFARVQEPNTDLAELYQKKYARYIKILDLMQDQWADLVWQA
jgi:L-xylulokinase